jgi:hypothetical protein
VYKNWIALKKEKEFPQPVSKLIGGYWGSTNSQIINIALLKREAEAVAPVAVVEQDLDKAKRPITPQELIKCGLSPEFGPSSAEWKIPSKRNKYRQLVQNINQRNAT